MFACCPFHLPPGKSKHFWSVALNPLVEQGEEMDSRSNHTYSVLHTNSMSVMATHSNLSSSLRTWWSVREPPWRCGVVRSAAPQGYWHYCCSLPVRWPQSHGTGPLWSEVCQWCGRNDCPSPRCQWSKPVAHRPPLHPAPQLPTNPHDWISSQHKSGLLVPVASRSTDHLRDAGKRLLSTSELGEISTYLESPYSEMYIFY